MKLCTVIAYYITSITKQLKFLNFYCSIVCSYCSVVCLIAKNELKKYNFFQGGPNFRGGTAGKFRENGQKQEHLFLCKLGVANLERKYQFLPPGTKILVMPQLSYMPDQILEKMKKLNFQAKI